jgi:DNA-binding IclR family transcriptional regulator
VKRNNYAVVMMKLNKVDEAVVKTLKAEGKGLSLQEITDKSGQPSKKVFKSLKKLFEHEMVDTQARKYRLLTDKVPSGKEAEAEEAEEE